MTRTPTTRTLLGLVLLGLPAPVALAGQAPVTLSGWAGPAVLVPNPGPGETLFLLRAEARWSPGAPRDRGRYALQLLLPGGRVERLALRPGEGPLSPIVTFPVPAEAVRNLRPEAVRVEASLVDAASGFLLSNPLSAGIGQFPTPAPPGARPPSGPFGWGRPLDPDPDGARPLPNEGPDGWRFVRVASTPDRPGFFIATTEATNRQVSGRLPGFDPNAGRSDEFSLDAPEQPAVNLVPQQAEAYLSALREADPAGVPFRLPTRDEWDLAAKAGKGSAFWWGDAPAFPEGANFLGPEPGEAADATAPASSPGPAYSPNPWGLSHTFGNVAEWASAGEGTSFARMGGHFRTEPLEALEPPVVDDPSSLGPDPYVGLRPAFDLDAEAGAALIRDRLSADSALADVAVSFDPDRATATLTGTVAGPADRRRAGEALRPLWFLAAVVDEIATPTAGAGRLATIGPTSGAPEPTRVLGRTLVRVPVAASWGEVLPVDGSDWWVNVFGPSGGHFAHRLGAGEAGTPTISVSVPAELLGPGRTARVALSLGAPASSTADPGIASDEAVLTLGR